jgi:hypothetical protein
MAAQSVRKAFRTMFIGLGGTGNEVVRRVKQEMLRHGYDLPVFQYLVLDTVPFNEEPGMNPLMQLRNGEEYLYIGGYNPNEILKRIDKWPVISHWWGSRDQTNLVTVDEGAGQMRSVGRMGFFRHFTKIQGRLERMVHEVMSGENREMALMKNFDVPNDKAPIIYLVFSLCGGTGSALFFDVAYVLRKLYGDIKPIVVGLAMLPGPYVQDIQSIPQKERIQANTYAALQELERLHNMGLGLEPRPNGRDIWDVQYATNFRVSSPDLPFDYIYLIDDTTIRGERYKREQIYGLMSQAIFWLSGPSTAMRFWERAKNLNSNTLAAGGHPDASGQLRLSKYSSLGIGTAMLDWRFERVQQELESLILRRIQTTSSVKPTLSNWLGNADVLINKVADEPGVNPIPRNNAFKPTGPFRDRAYVDEMLENYTTKYEAALATLQRSIKWLRCRERYKKEALNELDTLFHKSLIELGPLAAFQQMETIKESLDSAVKKLDELDGKATQEEARLQKEYEVTIRTLASENRFLRLLSAIGAIVKGLYGLKNTSTERELSTLAENTAHQRYLWYSERFRMYLCRDAKKYIIEPAIAHAEKLKGILEGIDDALETWQDSINQQAPALEGTDELPGFEAIIRIRPRHSEQKQIREAIKRGDIKPDALISKVLKQAFDSWPKQGGNALNDLRTAMSILVPEALQRLGVHEHLLDQLLGPDAWKQREMFLKRAECMWSFEKDANQQVLPHLESINILGYGIDRDLRDQNRQGQDLNAQLNQLLKQQEAPPEQVPTDISNELTYIKTLHGLLISLIRSMPELHHAYQVMNIVRAAPYLHLDYRDQVSAGYGPLTSIEMTSQQIVDTWAEVADDVERSMSKLAAPIRDTVFQYERSRQRVLHEMVQVDNENDPLFDLVGMIEETILPQNKTPVVSETLTKLSYLIGLLHAQGWVTISPPYGAHFDPTLHQKEAVREEPGLPPDRVIEVKRRGYIRQRPNKRDQVRKALVILSIDTGGFDRGLQAQSQSNF